MFRQETDVSLWASILPSVKWAAPGLHTQGGRILLQWLESGGWEDFVTAGGDRKDWEFWEISQQRPRESVFLSTY